MGLGDHPDEWADYEWVRLSELPAPRPPEPEPLTLAVAAWLTREDVWTGHGGPRVLLVDLDNLRAAPARWRERMRLVVALARQAEHVALAGQHAAARRARAHLEEFAPLVRGVANGSDLADHVLLDFAAALPAPGEAPRYVVVSNDFIFADLAERGPLTVLSPGADALSGRLREAARRVIDLAGLESELAHVPAARARGHRTRGVQKSASSQS